MSLAIKLETTPHREVAGSDAYAAFEFQLMFGVELLFENYDKLDDFAVLFEFHDDVALLVGTKTPTRIEFFQLKHSTAGNWTMAKLSAMKKKQSSSKREQSILHKLYGNVRAFEEYTENAQVVSNLYCAEFGQQDNNKFDVLDDESKSKILTHLRTVYPSATGDCLSVLGFRRTELDKSACDDLVKGRIHSFLQDKIGGDAFPLQPCTDAIVGQCRIRSRKLASNVSGKTGEIVAQKGITKSDLDRWLSEIASNRSAPDWSTVQQHLLADAPFAELNKVRLAYDDFRITALDAGNDAQNDLARHVRAALDGEELPDAQLWQFLAKVIQAHSLEVVASKNGYSTAQLKAMVLYETFKTKPAGTIQEAHQKSQEKV